MKCVIFAGGRGSRIRTDEDFTPKPLVKIGDMPIIWHVMKIYSYYGIKDFIICLGYRIDLFKEFFRTVNEDWNIKLIDTGLHTCTGGRLKKIEKYIDEDEFALTYADAVSDIDIGDLIEFHKKHKKLLTLSVFKSKERFGIFEIKNNKIKNFREKELRECEWINGGYMIVNKKIFNYLNKDSGPFESVLIQRLMETNDVIAYQYDGFWQCMDYRDEQRLLNNLIKNKKDVWRKWNE